MIPIPKADLLKMRGGFERGFEDLLVDVMLELHDWDIAHMPLPLFMSIVRRLHQRYEESKRT